MPFGLFRKKKKKNLPEPPSFSKDDDSPFSELQRELKVTKTSRTSELPGPQRKKIPSSPRAEISGPPRESFSPPVREPTIFKGPPRHPHTKDVTRPSNLPSPPPLSSEQSTKDPASLFGNEIIADEIHAELRQKEFGSDMKKVPERKAASISTDELTRRHFRDTRQDYIEAGNKHLELNFYDNAATNYACAILCDVIGGGWQRARRTMSDLSAGTPSAVTENIIFDSVRQIIEAIRTKNFTFLTRAERTIKSNTENLYPEDIAIIKKALITARAQFGY